MNVQVHQLTESERKIQRIASQWFDDHEDSFTEDLLSWVSVPSVSEVEDASPGKPYGHAVADMFFTAAERAESFGFPAIDHGFALEVNYKNDADGDFGDIALVSHLDVVPAGQGWDYDPFKPFVKDGYVVGRGSSDNKAGALIDLYLLRFLKEQRISLRHPLKVLYGGAEETTLDDMREYVRIFGAPHQAVVTDSPFPANNAQKGHIVLDARIPVGTILRRLSAGTASNAVPGEAEIVIPGIDESTLKASLDAEQANSLEIVRDESSNGSRVIAHGISGHAAFPDHTRNAIVVLLDGLLKANNELRFLDKKDILAAGSLRDWFSDPYASGTTIDYEDAESGRTTQNLGVVKPESSDLQALIVTVDIRYSVTQSYDDILHSLNEKFAAAQAEIVRVEHSEPFYVPEDDVRVQALLSSFNGVVGSSLSSNAMGGGTHARVIPNALNFGPGLDPKLAEGTATHIDGKPSFIPEGKGSSHGADEWVSLRNCKLAFLIYVAGILRLDKVLDAESASEDVEK